MNRYIVLSLGLLVFAPVTLAGQRATTPAQRMEAAIDRAAEAGIPRELLEDRLAEGRAKGVSEERIAVAIERRAAGLAQAREAMMAAGIRPSTDDLAVGADAMEAGVDAVSLQTVIRTARAEERPVAIAVLTELVRQGLPVANARDRVTASLRARDGRLVDLPRNAAAERAAGGRGVGRPANPGGGRPGGAGAGGPGQGGPPAGVPSGRPDGAGRPDGVGGGPPTSPGSGRGGGR